MTTICEPRPLTPAPSDAARQFADELMRLHGAVRYPELVDALQGEPLCRLDGFGDGLTTISFRQHQMPERYLRAVLGFRLAQFLATGLIDVELVHRRVLFHEPVVDAAGPDTIHTVTLTDDGAIAGYIAMVGSPDLEPLPLDAVGRCRFPAEQAHDVDLLSDLAAPGRSTHAAYEIKRFVRDGSLPRGARRDRVPWHLILAAGRVTLADREAIQVLLGDSGERGALRHLRLMGIDPRIVEGTRPALPRSELMWPSYLLPPERLAKPFVGVVPADAGDFVDAVEQALAIRTDGHWQREAIGLLLERHRASGRLERLTGAA